jgi:hypothetical protein
MREFLCPATLSTGKGCRYFTATVCRDRLRSDPSGDGSKMPGRCLMIIEDDMNMNEEIRVAPLGAGRSKNWND